MTVYDLLDEFLDDIDVFIGIDDTQEEDLYHGPTQDVMKLYHLSGEEITSGVTIWKNSLYITINPEDDELKEIRKEIEESGYDYQDPYEA